MQHRPFSLLFALAVFAWAIWIVLATDGNLRIARGCEPVNWTGNVVVTLASVMNPTWEAGTQHFFDRSDYVCRLTLWRLFYEKSWRATHPKAKVPGNDGQPVSAGPDPAEAKQPENKPAGDVSPAKTPSSQQPQGQGHSPW